jgi:hypothetical protein
MHSPKFPSLIFELTGRDLSVNAGDLPLLQLLTEAIEELLKQPGEKLFQILYRLDVPEEKVNRILKIHPPGEWPAALAQLVLEREKKRMYWKERYRESSISYPATDNQQDKWN